MTLGKPTLILGCGNLPSDEAVNHDIVKHRDDIDVVWDLNDMPWPFADEQFELVVARAVLEHLDRSLLESLNECWRILKPDGVLDIKLPYWRSEVSYNDPSHRWSVGVNVFDQLDPSTPRGKEYGFYSPCKWKILGCGLNRGGSSVIARLRKIGNEDNGESPE